MVKPAFTDLNFEEVHYCPFIISMNRFGGSCDTIEDLFGRICVPNKMEDVNLKVFNMIKGTNKSKALEKHISCGSRCRKCTLIEYNPKQKWNNEKCQ